MLALLIAVAACAQPSPSPTPGLSAPSAPPAASAVVDFKAAGCGTSVTPRHGGPVTVIRNSAGTYQCNGMQTATANQPRIEADGLLVEPYGANWFVQSGSPANQNMTNAVGNWVGWIEGAGSVDFAAGTAVVSDGLPCTATAASPCRWTVGTAGTVSATVTAPVTFAQVEPGIEVSSKINTAGAAVARWDENGQQSWPPVANQRWTAMITIKPSTGTDWADYTGANRRIAWQTDVVSNNSAKLMVGNDVLFAQYTGSGVYKSQQFEYTATDEHTIVISNDNGTIEHLLDGNPVASIDVTAGGSTGVWSAVPTVVKLGGPVYGLYGHIGEWRVCRRARDPKCGWALADTVQVLALGDSRTVNEYPAWLNGLLGPGYTVINSGVSGCVASECSARYFATYKGKIDWLVWLCGINDINRGTPAAAIYATAAAVFDDARADGVEVIIIKETPFAGYSGWSADRQAQWDALNALYDTYPGGATVLDLTTGLGDGGTPPALSETCDSGDGLHPSAACKRTVIAAGVDAVISP